MRVLFVKYSLASNGSRNRLVQDPAKVMLVSWALFAVGRLVSQELAGTHLLLEARLVHG